MDKNKLPATLQLAPQLVTKQVVESLFTTEMTRRNYQKILQAIQNLQPTKENLASVYEKMKQAEDFLKEMEDVRKSISDPYFKTQKLVKGTFDEVVTILSDAVKSLKSEIVTVNSQVWEEDSVAKKEIDRVNNIKNSMISFINQTAIEIGNAQDDAILVLIQKRVGTEKSRKNFYQEFIDDFAQKCNSLTELINIRKETIKTGNRLQGDLLEAIAREDVEMQVEIREEIEVLERRMEENIIRIQETAYEQSLSTEIVVGEPTGDKIKGRSLWKWRVDDMQKLFKKTPEFVSLEPNVAEIGKYLSENKDKWREEGKKEVNVNGLIFYLENKI
jgi:anion-transporting  ArsA/GET3 family ATPase